MPRNIYIAYQCNVDILPNVILCHLYRHPLTSSIFWKKIVIWINLKVIFIAHSRDKVPWWSWESTGSAGHPALMCDVGAMVVHVWQQNSELKTPKITFKNTFWGTSKNQILDLKICADLSWLPISKMVWNLTIGSAVWMLELSKVGWEDLRRCGKFFREQERSRTLWF